MDGADQGQPRPLSNDEFWEWAVATFPALDSLSLDHPYVPTSAGSAMPPRPVFISPAQQTSDFENSRNPSGHRRERTASVNSIEGADSFRPRKRLHVEDNSNEIKDGQELFNYGPSAGPVAYPSFPVYQPQSDVLNYQHQSSSQIASGPRPLPLVRTSNGIGGSPNRDQEAPHSRQEASYIFSTPPLLPPQIIHQNVSVHQASPIGHHLAVGATLVASINDDRFIATHSPTRLLALMARFGIAGAQDLSRLTRIEAIKILDRIYIVCGASVQQNLPSNPPS
ncbi:hypothetical protein DL93DRAFT_605030 [Clavulina sp. PMI_390]|nr:hypothetical protein DL93DRAFT_605030 [Clavulina sp. PMI_390]